MDIYIYMDVCRYTHIYVHIPYIYTVQPERVTTAARTGLQAVQVTMTPCNDYSSTIISHIGFHSVGLQLTLICCFTYPPTYVYAGKAI